MEKYEFIFNVHTYKFFVTCNQLLRYEVDFYTVFSIMMHSIVHKKRNYHMKANILIKYIS